MTSVKQPRVFNVFYGDEDYLLDRERRRALKWPNRSVITLDGLEVNEVTVVEALGESVTDEDSDGTVVVLDNAEKVKVTTALIAYVTERDSRDRSSLLVAICRGAQLPKGWAEVAKQGRATAHLKLKPWERDKIKERVLGESKALGLRLEEGAFDVLYLLHGEQTGSILNEIRKAAYLVEKGAPITQDAILAVCGRRHAAAPWSVSEAAFSKDPKRALRAIALLVQERGDEVLVPIAAALMRQLETFLILRQMLDQQATPEAMGVALGLHPYRVQKDLPAVKKHTLPQLLIQMKNLCDLEVHLKGPATAKRTRVELAVLSLAA